MFRYPDLKVDDHYRARGWGGRHMRAFAPSPLALISSFRHGRLKTSDCQLITSYGKEGRTMQKATFVFATLCAVASGGILFAD